MEVNLIVHAPNRLDHQNIPPVTGSVLKFSVERTQTPSVQPKVQYIHVLTVSEEYRLSLHDIHACVILIVNNAWWSV